MTAVVTASTATSAHCPQARQAATAPFTALVLAALDALARLTAPPPKAATG